MMMRDCSSILGLLICGVPQGSTLFAMIVNVFMKLLGEDIWEFELKYQKYPDDTQLHTFFVLGSQGGYRNCEFMFEVSLGVGGIWKLKLNPEKMAKLLIRGSVGWSGHIKSVLDRTAFPQKDQVHSWGKSWTQHCLGCLMTSFHQVHLVCLLVCLQQIWVTYT